MADTEVKIKEAVDAMRRIANSRAGITLSAIDEIAHCVASVVRMTANADIEREGERLLSSALRNYSNPDNKPGIVVIARFHGAIGRFEFALQQLGFLPHRDEPPTQFARRTLGADC